jgi:hypothetical protein
MFQSLRRNQRFASAFATFVCAWALAMAALALATTPHTERPREAPLVLSAEVAR